MSVDRAWKKLEFQLVFWTSSSHVVFTQAHFLLVLVNDLVGGWLSWTLAHWTSSLSKFLAQQENLYLLQRAKKVVYDSPGLVDFAIGLVNSVFNLPDGQVMFFEEFKLQKNCEINLLIKTFLGLVEMMLGLVIVSFSLPKWQAVKMTFFAPCTCTRLPDGTFSSPE